MKIVLFSVLLALTAGCSFEVIPPAHKGKILSSAGYSPEILPPGKITTWWRQSLVLLETGTGTYKESMTVIMRDKLTLNFDVRFRARINGESAVLNAMFDDIAPHKGKLTLAQVYATYGQMIVRNKAREVLSDYSVEDVHTNYKAISAALFSAIKPAVEGTPLQVSDISLANIRYPQVVTDAVEQAKARTMKIEQEKAQAEIELVKKENERRLAEADYQIRITKARAIRDENKMIAEGVTPALIEFRRLEVLEKMAANQNAIFMPIEAMTSPGAQMRIFGK